MKIEVSPENGWMVPSSAAALSNSRNEVVPTATIRRRWRAEHNAYPDTSGGFGLPQSEECSGTTQGGSKKIGIARDILRRCGVLLAAIEPHRLDGDGQCASRALANALYVIPQTTISSAQHNLERECRYETRVSLSHNWRQPAASDGWCGFCRKSPYGVEQGTARHDCQCELWHHYYRRRHNYLGNTRQFGSLARCSVQRTPTRWHGGGRKGGHRLCWIG